ncbi:MAG: tRNA (adenosine(37)-N6)-threonylcarbamoyltransferase complex dimerization subunit type 1 TsaB [Pedosphaera parvula]|nr:tRNA (adenosine(37)-N6)-threonylcarbamoyltransferase complex dimerization subunit type 1 TsaB [Pedosphaera parvula]
MKILALEFSSPRRSAAVLDTGKGSEPSVMGEAGESETCHTGAISLVESVLRQARVEREEIECLAVGIGPGSYTGIRAAISLAQGWQLARGVKLLGVSTAECLAYEARALGLQGRISCVIDAQRNEFYLATYEMDAPRVRCVETLHLVGVEEVRKRHAGGDRLVGPEVSRWFSNLPDVFPSAATLGRLAAARQDFVSGEALEPIYLRETSFVKAPPPRVIPE